MAGISIAFGFMVWFLEYVAEEVIHFMVAKKPKRKKEESSSLQSPSSDLTSFH
jgi:hypothetical protein